MGDSKTLRVTVIEDQKGDGFAKTAKHAKTAEKEIKESGKAGEKAGRQLSEGAERAGKSWLSVSKKIGDARVGITGSAKEALSFKNLGPGALLAGLSAGTALVTGLKSTLDITDAKAKMTAQLGLTATESGKYGKIAGDLYKQNYGESFAGVTEAIAKVRQNIGELGRGAGNDLSSLSKGVLTLSTVFGEDLEKSTGAVGTLLKNGLAKNGKEALDILTRGYQSGANKAGDLADTMIEYPAVFKRLGLSGTQALGLINQGLKAGARNSDLVADALKEFQIRATDGSKLSAQGFAALGLSAGKMTAQIAKGGPEASAGLQTVLDKLRAMTDPVKQNAAGVALFGTKWEDTGKALLALDPKTAVASLGKVAGAADAAGNALNTPSARFNQFKRSLQIGFVDMVGNAVGWATKNKQAFSDAFSGIKSIGGGIATFVKGIFQAFSGAGSVDIGKGISSGLATAGAKLKQFGGFIHDNQTTIQRWGLLTGAVLMTMGSAFLRMGASAVKIGGAITAALAGALYGVTVAIQKTLEAASHLPFIGDKFNEPAAKAKVLADGLKSVATNAVPAAKKIADGMTGAADKLDAGARKAAELSGNLSKVKSPHVTATVDTAGANAKMVALAKARLAKVNAMPETTAAERALKNVARQRAAKVLAVAEKRAADSSLNNAARNRTSKLSAAVLNANGVNATLNNTARARRANISTWTDTRDAESRLNYAARNRTAIINAITVSTTNNVRGVTSRNSAGGTIHGSGVRGMDSVHALLAPGEEVVRTASADKPGVRAALKYINATGELPPVISSTSAAGGGGDTYVTVIVESGVYSVDRLAKEIAPTIKTEIERAGVRGNKGGNR